MGGGGDDLTSLAELGHMSKPVLPDIGQQAPFFPPRHPSLWEGPGAVWQGFKVTERDKGRLPSCPTYRLTGDVTAVR